MRYQPITISEPKVVTFVTIRDLTFSIKYAIILSYSIEQQFNIPIGIISTLNTEYCYSNNGLNIHTFYSPITQKMTMGGLRHQ